MAQSTSGLMALPDELLVQIFRHRIQADIRAHGDCSTNFDLMFNSNRAFAVCPRYGTLYLTAYAEVADFRSLLRMGEDGSVYWDGDFRNCLDLKPMVRNLNLEVHVKHSEDGSFGFCAEYDEGGCKIVQKTVDELGKSLGGFEELRTIRMEVSGSAVMAEGKGEALVKGVMRILRGREEAMGRKLRFLGAAEHGLQFRFWMTSFSVKEGEWRDDSWVGSTESSRLQCGATTSASTHQLHVV